MIVGPGIRIQRAVAYVPGRRTGVLVGSGTGADLNLRVSASQSRHPPATGSGGFRQPGPAKSWSSTTSCVPPELRVEPRIVRRQTVARRINGIHAQTVDRVERIAELGSSAGRAACSAGRAHCCRPSADARSFPLSIRRRPMPTIPSKSIPSDDDFDRLIRLPDFQREVQSHLPGIRQGHVSLY